MKYQSVVLGGTFDHLHQGHQALLSKAFTIGNYVTIGLTTDKYVTNIKYQTCLPARQVSNDPTSPYGLPPSPRVRQTSRGAGKSNLKFQNPKEKRHAIQPYILRKQELENWLDETGWQGRYEIVKLDDAYGPLLDSRERREVGELRIAKRKWKAEGGIRKTEDGRRNKRNDSLRPTIYNLQSDFDAIVVSEETEKIALEINKKRAEYGLSPLAIEVIPMIPAEDMTRISSTRVRSGEIDRTGNLILPDSMRDDLRIPIGEVIEEGDFQKIVAGDKGKLIITVGDMTTNRLLLQNMNITCAIIDMQMERKPFLWEKDVYETLLQDRIIRHVQSGPGYIGKEAIQVLHDWTTTVQGRTLHGVVIMVDGEEDLLVLPAVVEAPLGSVIYYGQPRKGMVRIEVTEAKKERARELLTAFLVQT